MPGNTIEINLGRKKYYVGDSKMEELLKWLDKNGILLRDSTSVRKSAGIDEKPPPTPPATCGCPHSIYGSSYFEGLWRGIRRILRGASFVDYMPSNKLFELLLNPDGWPAGVLLEVRDELEYRGYSVEEELEWRKEQRKKISELDKLLSLKTEMKGSKIGDILDKAILDLKDILEREKRLLEKVQEDDSLPTYIAKMLENIIIDIEDLIEDLSIANDDEIRELINRI